MLWLSSLGSLYLYHQAVKGGLVGRWGSGPAQWERKTEVAMDRPIFVQHSIDFLFLGGNGPSFALRFGSIQVRAACMHAAHARLLLFY